MGDNTILKINPLGFPWETRDPFIFCAHHRDEYPKGNENMGPDASLMGRNLGQDFALRDGWRMYHGKTIPGFPYHPHRGFETVTVVKEGLVDHTDSLGAAGRFGEGDVQWMTAGKGVQHSEMFPLINRDKDNPLELFQIWLNLPKSRKMVEPYFRMLWEDTIPVLKKKDHNGKSIEVSIVAGHLNDLEAPAPTPDSWAADPENNVAILTIKLEANATWIVPGMDKDANRTLYFYKGNEIQVEGEAIPSYHSVEVRSDKDITMVAGGEDCYILMLHGKPIQEPVVQHGPFVMNTRVEIQQAYNDFQRTEFGGWPWPKHETTHDRNKGRFALHANGKEEIK